MRSGLRAVAVVVGLGFAGFGCEAQRHMTGTYGRAYHAAFAAQPVNPKGTPPGAPTLLDSQEAAAVATSYRKSLAPADAQQEAPPVIILSPQDARNAVPAASVPK